MAALRELRQEPFVVAAAGRLPVTAAHEAWVVLVNDTGPVTAVAPGSTLAEASRPPGILVAAADLDQGAAFGSAAFQEFMAVDALVLIEPSAVHGGRSDVAGVVSDVTLTRAMLRGGARGGPVLPGVPLVPLISRSCGYTEGRAACATLVSFERRPSPMPPCPNDHHLTAHAFTW
jgi:hypothetical protein